MVVEHCAALPRLPVAALPPSLAPRSPAILRFACVARLARPGWPLQQQSSLRWKQDYWVVVCVWGGGGCSTHAQTQVTRRPAQLLPASWMSAMSVSPCSSSAALMAW